MIKLQRLTDNPVLLPSAQNLWEEKGAFNGSVVKDNNKFHMVYRALSGTQNYLGINMQISSVGYAQSKDGIHFTNHKQLIKPLEEWELFGCEDPRITKINGRYFIFYTALSTHPFSPDGIKVGVAVTKDLNAIEERHLVTPFNAKAMALFPEKINGKLVGILTANTDRPPAKIGLAFFDKEERIWDKFFWEKWYERLDSNALPLQRNTNDQVEVGAPPIKTKDGWLIIYSYIVNYLSSPRIFGIEAVLLDLGNPLKVLGRTRGALLSPEKDYELYGNVPDVTFPSGSLVQNGELFVYYGAADTSCCLATCKLDDLLSELNFPPPPKLERFAGNPIIKPIQENPWESKATFNPAAVYEDGKVHIVYRAMSQDNTSVFGYAQSLDGFNISQRSKDPIYVPRESFEMKTVPNRNSGCEDPRITKIGDKFYMYYTAFDGTNPPRVAQTSIKVQDFLSKKWNWEKPKLISEPGVDDKDAGILPKKVNDMYVIFHRTTGAICLGFSKDLGFPKETYLTKSVLLKPKSDSWNSRKVGIAAPPIETEKGWLLLYHGISSNYSYKIGAVLLSLNDPTRILALTDYPILEPEMEYEKLGQVSNVVFPCGMVEINGNLFVYYGGADSVVCVATINKERLLRELIR